MVVVCLPVLPGACNLDTVPSTELSLNVSVDGNAQKDELLLVILWIFAEMLFVVLGKLDITQLARTGAKEITFLDT